MKEPIRILQVLGRLDRGGAETMLMNLYRCMDRKQIQFDFVIHTTDRCDYTEEIQRLGGKIYSMKPFRASTALSYRKQWRDFFREHTEYRIIHAHMRSTAALYLAEAKRAGLVTIAHSHNTSSGSGFSAIVKNVLQYPLRYEADYLFACSRLAGEWLYGKKASESSRFHILHNGIDPKLFQFDETKRREKRREMQVQEDTSVFLHVGRMEAQKNHKFLLRMMKELVGIEEDGKKPQLWLCGMGPLETVLKKQAEEEKITPYVRFLGVREDIPELMMAADVFLFPSLFEGLPVTVVEAQAAGLPVVMSERITEEVILTGLVRVCPLTDQRQKERPAVKKWAEETLLAADKSRKEQKDRGLYAERIVEKGYDVRVNADQLAIFYKRLYEDNI